MDKPSISYGQRPDATPDTECSTLAHIYKFVLDCHAKKKAATSTVSRPDDAKEIKNDSRHYHRNT